MPIYPRCGREVKAGLFNGNVLAWHYNAAGAAECPGSYVEIACSHYWINPSDPPIARASYAAIVGPGRHEMKPGVTGSVNGISEMHGRGGTSSNSRCQKLCNQCIPRMPHHDLPAPVRADPYLIELAEIALE